MPRPGDWRPGRVLGRRSGPLERDPVPAPDHPSRHDVGVEPQARPESEGTAGSLAVAALYSRQLRIPNTFTRQPG